MKTVKIFIAILLCVFAAAAQENLPVVKSNAEMISIQDGANLKKNGWRLAPEAKPDGEGRFRIENVPPGTYKIKLELPEGIEREEPFTFSASSSPCSRKWSIPVRRKPQKQQAESGNL